MKGTFVYPVSPALATLGFHYFYNWPRPFGPPDELAISDPFPPLFWEGPWPYAPPEVCDFLNTSEWRIQFALDPSALSGGWGSPPSAQSLDITLAAGTQSLFITTSIDPAVTLHSPGWLTQVELFEGWCEEDVTYPASTMDGESYLVGVDYLWSEPSADNPGYEFQTHLKLYLPWPVPALDDSDPLVEGWTLPFEPVNTLLCTFKETDGLTTLYSESAEAVTVNGEQHGEPSLVFPVVSIDATDYFT